MDCTAAHCDGYSPRCSCTNRTARSRTSGENLLFLLMAPFSQELKPPQNPVRFNLRQNNVLRVKPLDRFGRYTPSSLPLYLCKQSGLYGIVDHGGIQPCASRNLLKRETASVNSFHLQSKAKLALPRSSGQ